jgi:predicted nicotinamide N-methyase
MFSLTSFFEEYETDTSALTIAGKDFRILIPKSIDRFVDQEDVFHEFPLWSKIWEASIVLAQHLAGMPVEPERRFLEIGCGLGLVGVVAAAFGHRVTMTEYNPGALAFARANARTNLAPGYSNLKIVKMDWNRPRLEGRFDTIVASEVVYSEKDYDPILELFRRYLKPDGEIILAEGLRKTSMEFFRQMNAFFHIQAQKKVLRSSQETFRVMLCKMRFRETDPGSKANPE